jgi:hypothetical protein
VSTGARRSGSTSTRSASAPGRIRLRSVGSFIPLAQALATAVGIHRGTQSREELLSDERLLKQFSVYWS